jgi:hypothetical protein
MQGKIWERTRNGAIKSPVTAHVVDILSALGELQEDGATSDLPTGTFQPWDQCVKLRRRDSGPSVLPIAIGATSSNHSVCGGLQ